MIPTRIFLDLDDVCNDFTISALKFVGCLPSGATFDAYDPKWSFDIIKAANELRNQPRRPRIDCPADWKGDFTPDTFWSLMTREVWANLPESKEFHSLLSKCEELVGRENICILTNPIIDPECAVGKLEWIYKHFPTWMHRQFFIGPQKWLLARPDALLIDDSDANVKAFRGHGGQALLVPRPWNVLHEANTMKHIDWALQRFFEQKTRNCVR